MMVFTPASLALALARVSVPVPAAPVNPQVVAGAARVPLEMFQVLADTMEEVPMMRTPLLTLTPPTKVFWPLRVSPPEPAFVRVPF